MENCVVPFWYILDQLNSPGADLAQVNDRLHELLEPDIGSCHRRISHRLRGNGELLDTDTTRIEWYMKKFGMDPLSLPRNRYLQEVQMVLPLMGEVGHTQLFLRELPRIRQNHPEEDPYEKTRACTLSSDTALFCAEGERRRGQAALLPQASKRHFRQAALLLGIHEELQGDLQALKGTLLGLAD